MPAVPPDEPATAAAAGRLHAFRAMRHRGYRAWYVAQLVSFLGTWMQGVALGWLVFRLTGSTLLLGVVTFASQIPVLLLAPIAGVLADAAPLRRVIVATQSLLALCALALALLAGFGTPTVGAIVAIAAATGVVVAFDLPARQLMLTELAGPEDLPSAIALSSTAVNAARIVGPALGGVVVAAVGEAACFAINAVTFLAMIGAAALVRPAHERAVSTPEPPLRALSAGVSYARRAAHVRALLPVVAVVSIAGLPYVTLLPAFAGDVLDGGPTLLGWLNAAVGVGAIAGALSVASLADRRALLPRVAVGLTAFGLGLLGLGLSRWAWLSLASLALSGFGMLASLSSANTILQGDTPDEIRGRVMSLYTTVLVGLYPLGALGTGAVAGRAGVGATVAGTGVVLLGTAAWFSRRLGPLRSARVGEAVGSG